jgi:hypothetical protein
MKAAPAPTSAFGHSGVAYVDTCSDSSLIKAKKCIELGIRMRRLDGSTMHMSTACGVVSQPLVVTEPVHLQFGKGTKHEHRLVCNFVVLNDESLHYDVLLGTPVLRVLGSCICFASNTLTIRPRWWLHNDMTTAFSLPVIASVAHDQDTRPAEVCDPLIAALQGASTNAVTHTVPHAAADADDCTESAGLIEFLGNTHPVLGG